MVICNDRDLRGRQLKPGREGMSHGLYDDARQLMLLSLESFSIRPMPHLSSRAELLRENGIPEAYPTTLSPGTPGDLVHRDAVRVTMLRPRASVPCDEVVDTSDPVAVRKLLSLLVNTASVVQDVDHVGLKAAWRADVAAGRTDDSFESFAKKASA